MTCPLCDLPTPDGRHYTPTEARTCLRQRSSRYVQAATDKRRNI